ncbi:MAG TPA: TonB-dependent receptor [Ohtaekwangia sp.]
MTKHYLIDRYLKWCWFTIALLSVVQLATAQEHMYADAKNTDNHSRQGRRFLHDVLPEIQAHFKISFIYESGVIEGKEIVGKVSYSNNVEKTLNTVLTPVGLTYRKVNKSTYSILSASSDSPIATAIDGSASIINGTDDPDPDADSKSAHSSSYEQEADIQVSGRVTDAESNAIPGANILIKGTALGTTTDTEGKFSLSVPDAGSILVISFIGYLSKEVVVGNQTEINVMLEADIQQLGEVVVVGYGTQKKASVTGAISSVSAQEISAQPVVNVGQALQGRIAGVTVVNNGSPGEAPIIRVRGVGTINNANPLFVVDGFPTSDLNSFNPKDIQSVDVLKDASAAAIYGSRASNGVVIITTKSGSNNQKLSVNFDSYYGVEQPWKQLDLLNTEQYVDFATDLMTNADIYFNETNDPAASGVPDRVVGVSVPDRIELGGMGLPINSQTSQTFSQTNTDWQDEMFRTGRIQQHKVELSGGSASSKMFASLGYFEQEGIMLGTGYQRGDARINSDHNVSKRLTVGQNFYVAYDERKIEQQAGGRTQLQHMFRSSPYFPVYNPDNFGGFFGAQSVDGSDPENPVRIATQDKQNQQRLKLLANAYVDVKIFDFLSYRFKAGVDYVDYTQRSHSPAYSTNGYSNRAAAQINQNRQHFTSVLLTSQLTFNKTFGQHAINATVVAEQQTNNFSQITGNGENAISNEITEPVGLSGVGFNGNKTESALISYIGRVNYEFNGKYLIGASFRRDGSSRFSPDNRWGNFPAVSAGWRISEESFLANNEVVSDLKLRASYGVTGNNTTGTNTNADYPWISTISSNQIYQLGGAPVTGYTIRSLANPTLHWESTYMTNIGVDMGILNNQFTLSVEYFNSRTKDMIVQRPTPLSYGYDIAPFDNVGEVENKGVELELGYEKVQGDFTFNASGNISFVKNEVISLGDEGTTIAQGDWYGDNLTLTKVGEPIGYFNGYVVDGIFQEGESTAMQPNARPGDIRFKDVTGDGLLNSEDKINVGHFLPDFTYGVNFSANWKGFDASLFLQGVSGNEIYSIVKYDLEGMSRLFNAGTAVLDRWTPENTDTNVPRAVSGDPNGNSRASDRFVEDGSYFRVKNLTLGYNFSSVGSATKNAVTRLRVYTTMQNLLTITKYKSGYDPEIGNRNNGMNGTTPLLTQGVDYGQFPQARSIVVGVQLGF